MNLTVLNAYLEPIENYTAEPVDRGTHETVRVDAPGYRPRTVIVKPNLRVFLGFDFDQVDGPELDDACEKNLYAAADFAPVGIGEDDEWGDSSFRESGSPTVTLHQFLGPCIERRQDRCFFRLDDGAELAERLDASDAWDEAPGALHEYRTNGSWAQRGSWKQAQVEPGLQLVMYEWGNEYVGELDIDEHKDIFGHVYEVLRNHSTGRLTHPWVINQALARKRGIVSFRMRPRQKERAA